MRYTHLLIDIDGTLLDFAPAQREAFFRTFEQYRRPADEALLDRYEVINSALWRRLEEGAVTRAEILTGRFSTLFSECDIPFDPLDFNRDYLHNLSLGAFPFEGAAQTLEALSRRCALVVATNGVGPTQRRRMQNAGLDRFFTAMAVSEELGVEKPDRRFFEQALALAGGPPPERVLMVGDSLVADIGGGRGAGLDTCWYNPGGLVLPEHPRPTHVISNLEQLVSIVLKEEPSCPEA